LTPVPAGRMAVSRVKRENLNEFVLLVFEIEALRIGIITLTSNNRDISDNYYKALNISDKYALNISGIYIIFIHYKTAALCTSYALWTTYLIPNKKPTREESVTCTPLEASQITYCRSKLTPASRPKGSM
jgi:hypothetical protein